MTQAKKTLTKAQKEAIKQQKQEERNAKMAGTLAKYRVGYQDSVTHNGRKSKVCGDDLSHAMAAVEPERAALIAEALLSLEDGFLMAKYAKLNPGQIKMNSVNRVRAAMKRGELTISQVKKAIRSVK